MYEEYDGIEVEAQDNGATIDLGEAMRLLNKYDMMTPLDCELDPLKVRWLAGQEASLLWSIGKQEGVQSLQEWDDEMPYIAWEND